MPSSVCFPPSWGVTLSNSLGVLVGKRHHRLWPETSAFHALVPNGSMWIPVPDRAGPNTNHLAKSFIKHYTVLWKLHKFNVNNTCKAVVFFHPHIEIDLPENIRALYTVPRVVSFSDAVKFGRYIAIWI